MHRKIEHVKFNSTSTNVIECYMSQPQFVVCFFFLWSLGFVFVFTMLNKKCTVCVSVCVCVPAQVRVMRGKRKGKWGKTKAEVSI